MEYVIAILIFAGLLVFFSNRNDKNKKKLQQHVANGDIDPAVLDGIYPTPADTTRQTFRQLANK
jgi:hypothetical protein